MDGACGIRQWLACHRTLRNVRAVLAQPHLAGYTRGSCHASEYEASFVMSKQQAVCGVLWCACMKSMWCMPASQHAQAVSPAPLKQAHALAGGLGSPPGSG